MWWTIKDWGVSGDRFHLVTEYIHGKDLESLLSGQSELRPSTKKYIVNKVYQGLQELKNKGICHGDLKPSNIMLSVKGEIKLIDVSFAEVGKVYATPKFTAPEVLSGSRPNFQSDLYSLGVISNSLNLKFKKLVSIEPGDRSLSPYILFNDSCEKKILSDIVRESISTRIPEKTNTLHTLELAAAQELGFNKATKLRTTLFYGVSALSIFLFCPLSPPQENTLPKLKSFKFRSSKSLELWAEDRWMPLPTDQNIIVNPNNSFQRLKFRSVEGIKYLNVRMDSEANGNVNLDAL